MLANSLFLLFVVLFDLDMRLIINVLCVLGGGE